jgi:hypothetical protein
MRRLAISSSALLLSTFLFTTPVLAAPPSNDLYARSTDITSLPFSETVDTTEATTDLDDEELHALCPEAPAIAASVWYTFTPTGDTGVMVDVSGSDYPAGVIVATGSPGSFDFVACNAFQVGFDATGGTTYTILAFDFGEAGAGGNLSITVDEAIVPTMDVTVDPVGSFDPQTGSATITGTATCSSDAAIGFIDIELRQQVGRFVVSGFGTTEVVCDDTEQPWSAEVTSFNGLFKGGRAAVLAFGSACGEFFCGQDVEDVTVQLRR